MKTIIISDNIDKKILKESILLRDLPKSVVDSIERNKTSLGDNPAIPSYYGSDFIKDATLKRFEETKDKLRTFGKIDDFSDTNPYSMLSKLIVKCHEYEAPIRMQLEQLCYNKLIELFDIPDGFISFDLQLEKPKDNELGDISIDSIPAPDRTYGDTSEIEDFSNLVYKRRLLNVLRTGAAHQFACDISSFVTDIYKLNPKLPELYDKIMSLNDYLLFTNDSIGINDKDKKMSGISKLYISDGNQSTLVVRGEIFPILFYEAIKGCFELFATRSLPSDNKLLQDLINRADFVKAEPWDMRLGPELWNYIIDDGEVDTNLLPFLFMNISALPIKKFNLLFKELFSKTLKGKVLMKRLINKSIKDKNYNDFEGRMRKANLDHSLITDEYINPEEL